MNAEHELRIGGIAAIPGQPLVAIWGEDRPGVFRVLSVSECRWVPVDPADDPASAPKSIDEWVPLPRTGLEVRHDSVLRGLVYLRESGVN